MVGCFEYGREARTSPTKLLARPPVYCRLEICSELNPAEKLQALLLDEKGNAEGFEPIPRRFIETAKILLDVWVFCQKKSTVVDFLLTMNVARQTICTSQPLFGHS